MQPADRRPDDDAPAPHSLGDLPAGASGAVDETGSAAASGAVDETGPVVEQPAPSAREDAEEVRRQDTAMAAKVGKIRDGRSPKDMALSLLVLLVPIALLIGFYRVFLNGDQPAVVDPAPVVQQARTANTFPVLQPVGLSSGWRTVNARYQPGGDGNTLRLGYLSPDGQGVQLVQSNVPPEKLLPGVTANGQAVGATEIAGQNWQRYTARSNERALVLLTPNRTVIVIGSAREQELRELAGSLH